MIRKRAGSYDKARLTPLHESRPCQQASPDAQTSMETYRPKPPIESAAPKRYPRDVSMKEAVGSPMFSANPSNLLSFVSF